MQVLSDYLIIMLSEHVGVISGDIEEIDWSGIDNMNCESKNSSLKSKLRLL